MSGFGGWPLGAYEDVVKDVAAEWESAAARAGALGVPRTSLVMDPGLGFSKASVHSFELLRRAAELVRRVHEHGEVPILFGASRKSFLTLVTSPSSSSPRGPRPEPTPPEQRAGASIAAALHAVRAGVQIVRIHDVRATRQAIDTEIVLGTARRKI